MTVYVVHVPVRWNGFRMESRDLSPAAKFGDFNVIFPGLDRPPPAQEALPVLKKAICGFKPADYLVIAGDMDLVIWAAALALKNTGGILQLLKWDGRNHRYDVMQSPEGLLT